MKNLAGSSGSFSSLDEESKIELLNRMKAEGLSQKVIEVLRSGLSEESWRVRKTAVEIILQKKENEKIRQLLIEGLHSHENAGFRNSATEALIRFGEKALPILKKAIRDADKDVRKIVLDIFGEIKCPQCLDTIRQFLNDSDENVRAAAAEAIGKIGDRRGISVLLKTLSKKDTYLRFTALESLSKLGELYGISDIEGITDCLDDSLLGRAAYDALGKSKNIHAARYILKGLTDLRRSHRESALMGLTNLHNSLVKKEKDILIKELRGIFNDYMKSELIKALKSYTGQIKLSSSAILSWMKVREAVSPMIELLKEDSLSDAVSRHLIDMGRDSVEEIMTQMRSSDDSIICKLCLVLGRIGDLRAEPYLIELLTNENEMVRASAAQALGEMGSKNSIKGLFKLFMDQDYTVRNSARSALLTLAKLYKNEVRRHAIEMTSSGDENLRSSAYFMLGSAGERNDLDLIALGLKDEKATVRQAAAEAFGELGEEEAVEKLSFAMTDEEHNVRLAVVKALSRIGGRNVLDALKLGIKDEHIWVRVAAVKAIQQTSGDESMQIIKEALNDDAPPVVISALEIFKDKGEKPFLKALSTVLLQNPNINVIRESLKMTKALKIKKALMVLKEALMHNTPEARLEILKYLVSEYKKHSMPLLKIAARVEKDEKVKKYLKEILQ